MIFRHLVEIPGASAAPTDAAKSPGVSSKTTHNYTHRRVSMLKKLFKNRRGAALVEYGLLIAGVALISAAAVSLFGHKTSDLIGMTAAILPGAHFNDNGPIMSGHLIETSTGGTSGSIALHIAGIPGQSNQKRLRVHVGGFSRHTTRIQRCIIRC